MFHANPGNVPVPWSNASAGAELTLPIFAGIDVYLHLDAAEGVTDAGGGAVSVWATTSLQTPGGTPNVSQATASERPTFVSSAINGRPGIDFDGGDFLHSATAAGYDPDSKAKFSIFVVGEADFGLGTLLCYPSAQSANTNSLQIDTSGGGRSRWFIRNNGGSDSILNISHSSVSVPTLHSLNVDFQHATPARELLGASNNTQGNTNAGGSNMQTDDNDLIIGSLTTGGSLFYDGVICEIAIYMDRFGPGTPAMTLSQFNEVRAYFSTKYGLGLTDVT